MHDTVIHGGDVWSIGAEFDIPVDSLLDFSANINPRGLPPIARERLRSDAGKSELIARYPDPSYPTLRRALANRDGISSDTILIGEGAEALIGAVLRAFAPARCLLSIPAFGEYERACTSAGTWIETSQLEGRDEFMLNQSAFVERLRSAQCDFAIVNNPHNPSGTLLRRQDVIDLVEKIRIGGASVLVDEAFIDYAPEETIIHYASTTPGVVVVRSLTKFFGCPALRVGYAVGHLSTLQEIGRALPTWPVTILAANALEAALQDREYAFRTLRENNKERTSMAASLTELGASVTPSAANFLLVRLQDQWPDSSSTREHLIHRHRVVVRNCDSFAGLAKGRYIRVAVRTVRDNNLLLEGLRELWQ